MKKMTTLSVLLFAAAMLVSCDKKSSGEEEAQGEGDYLVEYFAFQEEEDGPWGLMGTDGTVLVKPKFDASDVSCVVNDRFYVGSYDDGYTIYTAEKNPKKIGKYKKCGSFTGDLCPVLDMNDHFLYIDKDGEKVLDVTEIDGKKVQAAYNFFCGRAMINTEDGKWGFIDEEGKSVKGIEYADAWNYCEDLAIVYYDNPTYEDEDTGKWGVIDTEGKKLFQKRFCDMKPSEFKFAGGLLEVTDADSNYHLIDKDGKETVKLKEKTFTNFICEDAINVYNIETSKAGLMDKEGEWIIRPKFNSITFNGKILAASNEEEKFALYTMEGEKIADLPHGYVSLFDKNFKDYDSYLLVGTWEDGYKLVDSEGNKVDTDYKIRSYSTSFNWGFSNEQYDEEYYEDYEEDYEE